MTGEEKVKELELAFVGLGFADGFEALEEVFSELFHGSHSFAGQHARDEAGKTGLEIFLGAGLNDDLISDDAHPVDSKDGIAPSVAACRRQYRIWYRGVIKVHAVVPKEGHTLFYEVSIRDNGQINRICEQGHTGIV
jgi:hypothetical protein